MTRVTKDAQNKSKRAMQYLQASVAHADIHRLKSVHEVFCMTSGDLYLVDEMAKCASTIGYPAGAIRPGVTLWVGLSTAGADFVRDKYLFFAWAKDDKTGAVSPTWPQMLQLGIRDQHEFTKQLKLALKSEAHAGN